MDHFSQSVQKTIGKNFLFLSSFSSFPVIHSFSLISYCFILVLCHDFLLVFWLDKAGLGGVFGIKYQKNYLLILTIIMMAYIHFWLVK